jgi:hypothetical protein
MSIRERRTRSCDENWELTDLVATVPRPPRSSARTNFWIRPMSSNVDDWSRSDDAAGSWSLFFSIHESVVYSTYPA